MSTLNKLSVTTSSNKNSFGKETLYICQTCQLTEKELALTSRNYKYCSSCGNISIKSHLVESYNWVSTTDNFTTEGN